jgi:Rrf2 family nitric oxide-sensitive transcriptional repressor
MRLTRYTDYAMRVLTYLAARPEGLCSIGEISRAYGISQNHLMKVVNDLAREGFVASSRGRSGGIRLGLPAEEINVGVVVRHTEDGFDLVECGDCLIAPACGLNGVLSQALGAFMDVLDRYTLADIAVRKAELRGMFGIEPA